MLFQTAITYRATRDILQRSIQDERGFCTNRNKLRINESTSGKLSSVSKDCITSVSKEETITKKNNFFKHLQQTDAWGFEPLPSKDFVSSPGCFGCQVTTIQRYRILENTCTPH